MTKKDRKKVQKRGFTLIEILVVSTIVIAVSVIGLASYSGAQVGARDAQRKQDLDNTRTTLMLYRSENGYYPIASLDAQNRIVFSFPRQIVARMGAAFRPVSVQAATDDEFTDDDAQATSAPTAIPGFTIAPPNTAAPTPSANEGGNPAPAIVPGTGTEPEASLAYQEMSDILLEEGYLTEALPLDPVNNSTYYYGYDSDGVGFTVTARLEKDGSVVTLSE